MAGRDMVRFEHPARSPSSIAARGLADPSYGRPGTSVRSRISGSRPARRPPVQGGQHAAVGREESGFGVAESACRVEMYRPHTAWWTAMKASAYHGCARGTARPRTRSGGRPAGPLQPSSPDDPGAQCPDASNVQVQPLQQGEGKKTSAWWRVAQSPSPRRPAPCSGSGSAGRPVRRRDRARRGVDARAAGCPCPATIPCSGTRRGCRAADRADNWSARCG
jgi:hypothetical protein